MLRCYLSHPAFSRLKMACHVSARGATHPSAVMTFADVDDLSNLRQQRQCGLCRAIVASLAGSMPNESVTMI